MKIIISHDVDHITAWEHKKDLIIPKHLIRNCIELYKKSISLKEAARRISDIIRNKWNNLEDLMEFDRSQNIPSTFFFGVKKGMCLAYDISDVKFWAQKAQKDGFNVGVHGIAFERLKDIKDEYDTFSSITNLDSLGIRMHYLRRNTHTLENIAKAGYKFDSTMQSMAPPFKLSGLWEFPLHIMDGEIFSINKRWQDQTIEDAKEKTKTILEQADRDGIEYFTILLHDRYFSESFISWKNWYVWVLDYAKGNGYHFINYTDAIEELEKTTAGK